MPCAPEYGFRRLCLLTAVFLLIGGCQQEPEVLLPVTGRVTFQGVPVNGGVIVFAPDASKGEHGAIAHSTIQADGSYSLLTGDAAGARPGWYQVTFSCPGPPRSQPGQAYSSSESAIPEKYRHPELSKISCKVQVNQANSFDFDLK